MDKQVGLTPAEEWNVLDEMDVIRMATSSENGVPSWRHPYTLEHAFQERPPLEYAIDGIFPIPSLSIVYGAPGDFKSMLLMDAAICVATGTRWLVDDAGNQDTGWATRQLPTFWYDYDNGRRRCHERFNALAKGHNITPSSNVPLYYLSLPEPPLTATSLEWIEGCFKPALDQYGIQFLCIDNLSTIANNLDENSIEMTRVMFSLRAFIEKHNIACVIIHHERKGNGAKDRAGESLRGHSSINATIDLALQVKRDRKHHKVTVRSTKSRGIDVAQLEARFAFESRPDKELELARFYSHGSGVSSREDLLRSAVLEAFEENEEVNQSKLVEYLGTKQRSAKDKRLEAISDLVKAGTLTVRNGRNNSRIYRLASE